MEGQKALIKRKTTLLAVLIGAEVMVIACLITCFVWMANDMIEVLVKGGSVHFNMVSLEFFAISVLILACLSIWANKVVKELRNIQTGRHRIIFANEFEKRLQEYQKHRKTGTDGGI